MQASCSAGAARAPLGHASSSSTARLLAPLVLAAPRRRRRSAHQKEDLEEAVLHVQNQLAKSGGRARHIRWCCRLLLECMPACTTDLTDEHEHDERAGLGQEHHDGTVHDGQGTSTSQQQALVLVIETSFLRHRCGTQGRWPASSRRAAAATQRSARRSHAPTSTSRESSDFRPAELGGLIQLARARAGHSSSDETEAPQHVERAPILPALAFDSACRHAPLLVHSSLAQLASADQ